MFNDVEELRELIRKGKTNEEIIAERLKFLKKNDISTVKPIFNGSQVMFYGGFIGEDTLISADNGIIDETFYMADTTDLYNELIDTIRKNMDKKGIPLKIVAQKVLDYFAKSDNSQYRELIDFMHYFVPNNKYISRIYLPYIIQYYSNSNYEGSITDFGEYFMCWKLGKEGDKVKHKVGIEKMLSSIDWDKIGNESYVCKLSTLKGSGIAACTEKSMAVQNCLTFLGIESYIVGGYLDNGNNIEGHNFNVVKDSNGTYKIVDVAQAVIFPLKDINTPEDLLYLDGITATNGYGKKISYTSKYSNNKSSSKTTR